MADESVQEITVFLNDGGAMSTATKSRLQKLVYQDLRRVASNRLSNESHSNTMNVTALVHEAFLRLDQSSEMTWQSRRHYFGAAAESMRRILVDKARFEMRQRREGAKSEISLDEGLVVEGVTPDHLVRLDDALSDLEKQDEELADLVKLKYFAGLSAAEIAEMYESSERSMSRKIKAGRAWLYTQLNSPE